VDGEECGATVLRVPSTVFMGGRVKPDHDEP
jgi:hypothetical protein